MPTTKKLELYSYDANPDGSVKIPSLMKHFQQIAREDLLQYGITYNMMRDANQVFVIIKAGLKFLKPVSIYDELYLKTVPTKVMGITFFRDFFVYDGLGENCVVCTTSWVLIDFKSRRILKPSEIISEIPSFPDESSNLQLTRRFLFEAAPIFTSTNVREVFYSNLDENNHLNNTETAAFALDEISDKLVSGCKINKFEIHFNHESTLGNILDIKTEKRDNSSYITAYNRNFDCNAFDCYVEFE